MTGGDLAVHGPRIRTMDPRNIALDSGCLVIRAGVIAQVRPASECDCRSQGIEVIDASGLTALPGFVDGHRHTWQTVFRQSVAGRTFGEYGTAMLVERAKHFSPDDVYVGTLLGALTALDSGTTTIVDWAHAMNTPAHADAAVAALDDAGVRAQFAYGIPRDGTSQWTGGSVLGHPRDLSRMTSRLGDGRVRAAMAARGPEMSDPEVAKADVRFARELGVPISMHVGAARLGPEVRAIERLHEWGLLGPDMTFIHLNSTSDRELDLIADAGAGTCIGPATEIHMPGVGWPPTARLLQHGLRPALSVDTETATSGSMFDQLRAVLASVAGTDAHLSPEGALRLATADGAAAIGEAGRLGTLAPGAAGDVVLVDTGAVNLLPAIDAVASIVMAGHAGNVDSVIVDGRIVKRAGRLEGHDLAALAERAHRSLVGIEARR